MILRMWKDTKLAWCGKSSRIYLYTFILVSWNYTCGLGLDIFFVGWDIFILPIVTHTNLTNVPQITAAIFISWRHFGIGLLWVVHLCIDNKGFSTVMSWWLVLVTGVILLCYWSSSWQFQPSVPFAGIFYHCWVHKCLYLVVVVIYSATKILVPHLATVATNLKTN